MQGKQNIIADYRSRYRNAKRKEKTTILNEVLFITEYNRKYAITSYKGYSLFRSIRGSCMTEKQVITG
ncbi:MAG: hypothetical protein LBC27_05420, partial [Spirochaetaceae bacterium]|nr:hypothetical protein [Spirochaetaceae bacterium]